MKRVTVVGGGFAALEVVLALKAVAADVSVTVVSDQSAFAFRPWLIQLPSGRPQPPTIPFTELLTAAGVDLVAGRAAGTDLGRRRVWLDSGAEIEYEQLVVATGAEADRDRIPGAREHALFPCDPADAAEFSRQIRDCSDVAVAFGWERPGPGLEFAAWTAAHRPGVRVTAVDGDGTLERRLGASATRRIRQVLESRGGQLLSRGPLQAVQRGSFELERGTVTAGVIAVASPLRSCTGWLPAELLDESGRLRVDARMMAADGIFGIGDVVGVPKGYRLPPTLRSIQATSKGVARNVARVLQGEETRPVIKPGSPDMMGPDLAGTAILVRNRRLLLSGRIPLRLRSAGERRYLRRRRALG